MKKNLFTLFLLIIVGNSFSQITINNTVYTTNQLVNGVLVPGGSGTVVSNVNFRGVYGVSSKYQIGYFSTTGPTQTAMGFSNGIYLSTGNTSTVPLTLGTNPGSVAQMSTLYTSGTSGELRSSNPVAGQDADLGVLISPYNYYNGAVLEFDFVPVSTVASFRYIFASEEYNDESGSAFAINYNCSGYNDKFAFLISGPGILGGQGYMNNALNIATLANGSEVGINSVNDGIVGSSGSPQNAGLCTIENPGWINNTPTPEFMGFINGTNYNGNTDILTATKSGLTPGLTYHIKIIIADANDAGYDSGVYLEAGSFTTLSCIDPTAPTIGTITQPTCSTPTGSVALSGLPTSGTWTVTANPGGATLLGTGSSASFSGLTANTTYAFIVTNAEGCMSLVSANAAVNAIPAGPTAPIIGTITQPSCLIPTGSVSLTGLPATGSWTITANPGGATQTGTGTSASFIGLSSNTTYTFTVTNASGCISASSANAVVSLYTPTPPVVGTITQPTCAISTGSVALSGLPASGVWTVTASPGGFTLNLSGTTGTITGLTAGTPYTFIVTDNSGCLSSASTSAIINAQPVTPTTPILGVVTQPTCLVNLGSVVLSGLPSSGTWTINPGAIAGIGTSLTVSSLTAGGSYSFTVTNSSGCTSSATASVSINAVPTAPSAPIVGTVTQPSCLVPAGSVDLNGLPAGNWTITSSPGGLTQSGTGASVTFTGLSSNTTYTFTVTNTSTLCASPASGNAVINLYTPTPPIVGLITQPTCSVNTGTVALSGLPTPGEWTVTVSPGGATLGNFGTTANFTGLGAGTYTFTVTDNSGCISVASNSAVINSQPSTPLAPATGAITQPTCLVNTGSIELTGLPLGNWTINTIPGGAVGGSGSTYTFTGLPASSSYSYTITNEEGCTSITAITASLNAVPSLPNAPIIGTITQPTCTDPVGSVELSSLPAGTWTITATPGGTITAGSSITAIIDLSANATYTFTVSDANGCVSSMSTIVNIGALPAAPAAPTALVTIQPSCIIGTATIDVTAPIGANYKYSVDGITFQSGTSFTGLSPNTTYNVFVQDVTTGCISLNTSVVINAIPAAPVAPVVNIISQPTCVSTTGTLEIVSPIGVNYEYSIGGVYQSDLVFASLGAGQTYSVTVTDLTTGCISSSFDASINAIPTAEIVDAGPDYTINVGETVTLTATGNGTMVWNNGDITATTVNPTIQTIYTVTLTDANGCIDTDEATVFVAVDCGDLFVPTAFSPNGDAVNSYFKVKINPSCVKEMNLKVFDRWGEVVFETSDPNASWDGKYKEKDLDPAVFVYVLEIMLNSDTELQKLKGNLTLIK